MRVELEVNGTRHRVDVDPETPLLWVLRETLGLTGTKYGCGIAQCGACTVHMGGRPVRSCAIPVRVAQGSEIVTIEGLTGPVAAAVEESWVAEQVPQCGYCQSGQVMTTVALLHSIPKPTDEDIDRALAGNICRCATYVRIRRAVHGASERLGGGDS